MSVSTKTESMNYSFVVGLPEVSESEGGNQYDGCRQKVERELGRMLDDVGKASRLDAVDVEEEDHDTDHCQHQDQNPGEQAPIGPRTVDSDLLAEPSQGRQTGTASRPRTVVALVAGSWCCLGERQSGVAVLVVADVMPYHEVNGCTQN